jgi:predicted glycosyltransferase
MKIWFDISNSPQVLLFKDMLEDLRRQGHEILVTSRPLANTIDLLDSEKIPHTVIGKHYGKKLSSKLFGYPIRVYRLWQFLRDKQIHLSVSQSSFHAPVVAKLLGVKSIYTNDNEHAIGNIPAFLFANTILLPQNFKIENHILTTLISKKIIHYPGVKEGIYLWRKSYTKKISHLDKTKNLINVYIRPEPSTAQYYKGGENFLDEFILKSKEQYNITVLPRNKEQRKHYASSQFNGVSIPETVLSFDDIVKDCSVFIGAGGSMTREMALVGIPTLSVYQDKLLSVDNILINQKLLVYNPRFTFQDVHDLMKNNQQQKNAYMNYGKKAYELFISTINNNLNKYD